MAARLPKWIKPMRLRDMEGSHGKITYCDGSYRVIMFNEMNGIHTARDKIKQQAVANTMAKFRFSHFIADGMTATQELELFSYQSGNGLCS